MIKFIVVEDSEREQNVIKKVLRKISITNDNTISVEYYKRFSPELKKEIENTTVRKVYIMDIELEGKISGIDIANMIREVDWDSEIIFVTSHDQMFEFAHRKVLEVFDFIEKFIDMEKRLEMDINKIYKRKFDKKRLQIINRNVDLDIYFKNIIYINRDKEERKTVIHTNNDIEFKVGYSLNELLNELDNRFIQVHRSCIVNKDRISEYNFSKGYFVTDTGEKIDFLSKKFRKEIRNA